MNILLSIEIVILTTKSHMVSQTPTRIQLSNMLITSKYLLAKRSIASYADLFKLRIAGTKKLNIKQAAVKRIRTQPSTIQ